VIEIDGQQKRERFLVKIDGRSVYLTGAVFVILTKLAFARSQGDGWVHQVDLSQAGARYIYRLKQELGGKVVIENDQCGYYRVTDKVSFNKGVLKKHPDHGVSGLFEEAA
jgi:hypothetical protein